MSHDAESSNKPVVELVVLGCVAVLAAGAFMPRGGEQDATIETAEAFSRESPPAETHEQEATAEHAPPPAPSLEPGNAAASAPADPPPPTSVEPPAGVDPSAAPQEHESCTAPCRPPRRCIGGYCKLPEESTPPGGVAATERAASAAADESADDSTPGAPSGHERGKCAKGETECRGRCVHLRNDPKNCGDCGLVCTLLHQTGTPSCEAGRCVGGACQSGWANCDDMFGCETDITTSDNCGSCFTRCLWYDVNGQRVRGKCVNGACVAPTG